MKVDKVPLIVFVVNVQTPCKCGVIVQVGFMFNLLSMFLVARI